MQWSIVTSAILAAALLAACETTGPDRVETSNPTVSFEFDGDAELETATERADDYCDSYEKDARLRDVDEEDDGDDVAIFECI